MKYCATKTFKYRKHALEEQWFWNDEGNPAPFYCTLRFKASNKEKPWKLYFYEYPIE